MARMICHAGAAKLGLLLLIITSSVCAGAEPVPGGMFAIQGETGADPVALLDSSTPPPAVGAGPHLNYDAEGPGWVYSDNSAFVLTGSDRPWFIRVVAGPMQLEGGTGELIELVDIEARDAVAPTEWRAIDGMPTWQNETGNPAMYIELQFRINVRPEHVAGHYICHVTLQWAMPPVGVIPAASGTIPLELHVDVPEMFSFSVDPTEIVFEEDCGSAAGWIYSTNAELRVTSSLDFQISLSVAEDLNGPGGFQMPTAMMLSRTTPGVSPWASWGYLGGDGEGLGISPWPGDPDDASPWPGAIGTVHEGLGDNTYNINFGAWRNGLDDPQGDYSTTVVITIAVN